MGELFQSINHTFVEGRQEARGIEIGILALLGVLLSLHVYGIVQRILRRRSELRRFAEERGLDDDDLRLLAELATLAGCARMPLLTNLGLFERATAQAIGGPWSPFEPGGPERLLRLRAVRHALGFDRLPTHAPLLTTRELAPGIAVDVLGQHAQVFDVSESALSIEMDAPLQVATGERLTLNLAHARDARYELRCRVVEQQPGPNDRWNVVLDHDEEPRRVQQREFVRVKTNGPIVLRPLPAWPAPAMPREVRARLVDVSGGGAQVVTRAPLPVGLLSRASFTLGGSARFDVRAVVLASWPDSDGTARSNLEFSGLTDGERDRLVATVNSLQMVQKAAASR